MVIISILLGSAVIFFVGESDKAVENLSQQTQLLAKKTMRDAKDEQRAYSLFISSESIWAESEMRELEDGDTRSGTIEVDEDITISYQLDPEAGWQRIDSNDSPLIWTFTQTGLCEPLTLRFENDIAVDEISFHPLTAGKLINAD